MTRDCLKIFIFSLTCAVTFLTAITAAQDRPPPANQVLADHCFTCKHSTCEGDFPDSDPNCLKPRVNWTVIAKYAKCYDGRPFKMYCSDSETTQIDKKDQNGNPCKRIERGCGGKKVPKWPCQKISTPEYVSVTFQCYTKNIGWYPCNELPGYPSDPNRHCRNTRSDEGSGTLRRSIIDKRLVTGIVMMTLVAVYCTGGDGDSES